MDQDQGPPPLPSTEPAWITYLQAAGTIFPALVVWFFSNAWLLPKLEWLWQHTNLPGSKVQWLLDQNQMTPLTGELQLVTMKSMISRAPRRLGNKRFIHRFRRFSEPHFPAEEGADEFFEL
jgi:hypothetical protein